MSNRILWILVMIWIFGAGYLYYTFIIIPAKNVRIQERLEEQILLEQKKQAPVLVKQEIVDVELTKAEKIQFIKDKKSSYKTFKFSNTLKAFFLENNNRLELYLNDDKIWNFDLVYTQYLNVELILWTSRDLYIEVWKYKFYYNDKTKLISEIELNIDVNYVKIWTNNRLIFVTDKGSFVYSIFDKKLEYFNYFNDFVYINDWYVWLVRKDEKRILNNLWFDIEDFNLIVYYNSSTKEKKIIYETRLDIIQIYTKNDKLYLITEDNKIHELENV